MGTNYYLTRIPQEGEKIHVGKSSYGWKFAFQIGGANCLDMGDLEYTRINAYYVIIRYLMNGYELQDEYGNKSEFGGFVGLVERHTIEDEHYEYGEVVRDEIVKDGARWISTCFC